ncbi:EamA family transporter [Pseudonocardia sp. CA-107938]|uniref:EamA family transporter n=1 Tax=Pseudonocardia sp. CA-107938 TaxID=3240021 RepID=UPI003D8E0613
MLALVSALAYGFSDVVGGLAARRTRPLVVAFVGQVSGLVTMAVAVATLSPVTPAVADLAWGALSGLGTAAAMAFLFRGMARGAMSVVVPVSAVGGVALPVVVGVALLGERPSLIAWAGVVLVLPALWLVSRSGSATPTGPAVRDGLASGVGVAVQYLALAQAGADSGLWPVLAGRVTAVLAAGVLVLPERRMAPGVLAVAAGVLAAGALTAYQLAARTEYVSVAVVLSSLYPVVPVVVGLVALGERVGRRQGAGLVGALAAAALVALG